MIRPLCWPEEWAARRGFGSDLGNREHKPEVRTVTPGTESYRDIFQR